MDSTAKSNRQVAPLQNERISPREAELSKYREHRTSLLFTLLNGQELQGSIRWFDDLAIKVVQADRSEITVYHQAIGTYRVVTQ